MFNLTKLYYNDLFFARVNCRKFGMIKLAKTMQKGWKTIDFLLLSLHKQQNKPLYEQLYIELREAIISGQLAVGTKLPSKRQLADFLNISQTTIEFAYNQLLAEGYIQSKPRIGFFVEAVDELPYAEQLAPEISVPTTQTYAYDFSPANIDVESFPFTVWRKIAKDVIDESSKHLLQAGHPQGEYELRAQIARYLLESRGISCDAEQIVIGSGTEQLLPMILRLIDPQAMIALENPGYSPLPREDMKHRIIPIDVDEDGLIVEKLEKTNARLVYVTPSHQFPTGAVLSASRRAQLLKWATTHNNYIIEDDYDSEFRYIGKPIPAMLGLNKGANVIYMSTFSKSLMPSLRVAYFVLPKSLLEVYKKTFSYYSATVPRFDQHILAQFMQQGHFSKHLNRMRKTYRKKHDKLIEVLQTKYPDVRITGQLAGMHICISFASNYSETELTQKALQANIRIQPLSNYLVNVTKEQPTFILGFGGIDTEQIEQAVDALMHAFTT